MMFKTLYGLTRDYLQSRSTEEFCEQIGFSAAPHQLFHKNVFPTGDARFWSSLSPELRSTGSSTVSLSELQSNLSNTDTEGTEQSVRIREVTAITSLLRLH